MGFSIASFAKQYYQYNGTAVISQYLFCHTENNQIDMIKEIVSINFVLMREMNLGIK